MALVRYNPFSLTKTFDQLFDSFFDQNLTNFVGSDQFVSQPSVNIVEGPDKFRIEMAAPGYDKNDFQIELDNDVLTISVQKQEEQVNEDENFVRREFNYTSFQRSFQLPETVDPEQINAHYENGVLVIDLPKKEEAKEKPARKIDVK
ncbi:MAG: Hsp20/alpha crystallin family protein [Bacteroidetes bacterium]|nr:MAG: Hsp20/alpha crystallin family protein [Bacteroidota bacterium]